MPVRIGMLLLLFLLAGASVFGAYWAVEQRQQVQSSPPPKLFPALAEQREAITKLTLTYGKGLAGAESIVLTRRADGRFVVPKANNYPANEPRIARLLASLQELRPLGYRTARPEWHNRLGLVAPEKLGQAVRIEVFAGERKIAGLLLGREQVSEAERQVANMRAQSLEQIKRFYVRRSNEAQSFLVEGDVAVSQRLQDWYDPRLPFLRIEEVAELVVRSGTSQVKLARKERSAPFRNAEKQVVAQEQLAELFGNLRNLKIEAVVAAPLNAPTPPNANYLTLTSFGGTELTLEIVGLGTRGQLRFSAKGSERAEEWHRQYHQWHYGVAWGNLRPLLLR